MSEAEPGSATGIVGRVLRHPNGANLIMVLMILFGVFALGRINTQFFPTVEIPAVNVTVTWPGASAEDVEANILQVIEPEVRFVNGVVKMNSYSREGSGTISLEFERNADMQQATSDIEAAVKAIATLPEDSDTPKVSRVAFFDRVASLYVTGSVPEETLRFYAKRMRDDLIERGLDKVEFTGLRDRELQVRLDTADLRRTGLSVGDVSARIASNSRDLPSGQVSGDVEKQLRAVAEYRDPRALGSIEMRSLANGEKIMLEDIAEIGFGFEDGQTQGIVGGRNAIQLVVQRAPTADTLATAAILDTYLEEVMQSLPPGIEIVKYDVMADALVERIMLLVRNGVGGLIIVVATLFIFLNARIAFWVAAGIPVAMLATIGLMMLFGQTINMISLFALIMMLGIIVDDAIVVGEHTATRFAHGDGPFEAAENGAGRMITPVIAAMLTTAVAFAPILLVRDTIGQIMGVMPMVVIAVLIASLIECFFILPGHLAHALKPAGRRGWSYLRHLFFAATAGVFVMGLATRSSPGGMFSELAAMSTEVPLPLFLALVVAGSLAFGALIEGAIMAAGRLAQRRRERAGGWRGEDSLEGESALRRAFDAGFARFRDGPFSSLVELSFRWRYVTVSIALGLTMVVFLGLFVFGGRVQFVFFPSPEAENLNANLVFNAGIPEDRIREVIVELEESLARTEQSLAPDGEKLIAATFTTLGRSGRNVGDNLAEMRVQLTSSESRSVRTPEILAEWRRNLPRPAGLRRLAVSSARAGPPGRDVEIELGGADAETLKAAALEVSDLVSALPGASGVADDLPYGKPELVMTLTARGNALGFSLDNVGRQVRDAFEGAIPRRFVLDDDEVTIRVEQVSNQPGAAALRNFELRNPAGDFVPLSEVVTLSERQGFAAIRRLDGKTTVSVSGDLDTDVMTTEQAVVQLEEGGLAAIAARYGIDYHFGGRNEERQRSFEDLQYGVMIALSVIYVILAWVFSSYWRPVAIILIIPFGIVGAVFGHWVLDYQLTIMSFISLLGLAGILVNDSIILVSRMDERLSWGESLEEAATGASRDRLRAVLLTSLTTIGGLVPLMFETSVQAQFIVPMAITIIFGLGLATLLVLFLVPAFVGIGGDINKALTAIFRNQQQARDGNSPRVAG